MVRVLNVAEKPSVAKTVSAILSNGSHSSVSCLHPSPPPHPNSPSVLPSSPPSPLFPPFCVCSGPV